MKSLHPSKFQLIANHIVRINQTMKRREASNRDFHSFFGASLETIVKIWDLCNFPDKTQPKHMMWALLFLKTYASEENLSSLAGVTPKTFRKWSWPCVAEIGNNMHKVVSSFLNFAVKFNIIFQI